MFRFALIRGLCMGLLLLIITGPLFGDPPLDTNILVNGGFETPLSSGWINTMDWSRASTLPDPVEGAYYLNPTVTSETSIWQDIDLVALGYDAHRLATGGYGIVYGGYQLSRTETVTDSGQIGVTTFDSLGGVIGSTNLGAHTGTDAWSWTEGGYRLDAETNSIRYGFTATPGTPATTNDALLDGASLSLHAYKIWTHGNTSASYTGDGQWALNANLQLGDTIGAGELNIATGGTVSTKHVYIAPVAGSTGSANIAGSLAIDGQLNVGNMGSGTMQIDAGGEVTGWWESYIGREAGSTGLLTVAGTFENYGGSGTVYLGMGGMAR